MPVYVQHPSDIRADEATLAKRLTRQNLVRAVPQSANSDGRRCTNTPRAFTIV